MEKRRQKPIAVTTREREILNERKRAFEKSTGREGDWGEFLRAITLFGLAAAGVYLLAKATRRAEQSVSVVCNECGHDFVMALPEDMGPAMYVRCPNCERELVVDLRSAGAN